MRPHPGHGPRCALVPLLILLAIAATTLGAAAQDDGFTVARIDSETSVRPGDTATLVWEVTAFGGNRTIVAALDHDGRSDWNVTVTPQQIALQDGGTGRFSVAAQPGERPQPRTLGLTLRLLVLSGDGSVEETHHTATVEAVGTRLVLGLWENPLPPPLDGAWGAFLANVVAWTVVAALAMFAIDPTLRLVTRRTKTDFDDHIIRIVRFPVFVVLATHGLRQSVEVFDLPDLVLRFLGSLWTLVLLVAAFYVAYRVWQEVIVHIGKRMAAKTESRLDDRLIPVLEKVGGVIIVIVGIFFVIDNLGFDMTVLAAGGVLGGMVIAFAAQDSLSNFFSGVQILTDQPFVEGDEILLDTGEVVIVKKIGLRSTELYHPANHEVILIPNNKLAQNRIINVLRPDRLYKIRVNVGVAYGSDVALVKKTLLDLVDEHPLTLKDKGHEPFVRFGAFGASSLDFAVHAWVGDVKARWAVASDLREMIDARFAQLAIEIPFPQQVNWDGAKEAKALAQRRQENQERPSHETRPHKTLQSATKEVGLGDKVDDRSEGERD